MIKPAFPSLVLFLILDFLMIGVMQAEVVLTVSKGGVGHEADVELSWSSSTSQDIWVHSIGGPFDLLMRTVPPVQYHSGALNDGINHDYEVVDPGSMLPPGELFTTDGIIGRMRYIPASTPWGFIQGSPLDEPCRHPEEGQFAHTLTRNIVVMETEATQRMWADLKAVQPTLPDDQSYPTYGSGSDYSLNNATWYEAVLFANLLSVQNMYGRCYYKDAAFTILVDSTNYTSGTFYCDFTASGYRLLSEGEWEYAGRAGTTGPFFCDETDYASENCTSCNVEDHPILQQYVVYCASAGGSPQPVSSKLANPWNHYDMPGNVREWCWDWHGAYPVDSTDYAGPASGSHRILRGSMFVCMARNMRSAWRDWFTPNTCGQYIGFRLARSAK